MEAKKNARASDDNIKNQAVPIRSVKTDRLKVSILEHLIFLFFFFLCFRFSVSSCVRFSSNMQVLFRAVHDKRVTPASCWFLVKILIVCPMSSPLVPSFCVRQPPMSALHFCSPSRGNA